MEKYFGEEGENRKTTPLDKYNFICVDILFFLPFKIYYIIRATSVAYWDRIWALVGVIKLDIWSGRLVVGNRLLPYMLVITLENMTSKVCLRESAADRALLHIDGQAESVRASFLKHPDYQTASHKEPPRTMGDGFAILQTASLHFFYHQDILGYVTDDEQSINSKRPVWESIWRFGHNTVISYGPWAEYQRALIYAFFFPPDYQTMPTTELPKRSKRRIYIMHDVRISLLKETSIDIWFMRNEQLESIHNRCQPGSTIDMSIWWITKEEGFSWSARLSLLNVESTTSLFYRKLLESETLRIDCEFSYPRVSFSLPFIDFLPDILSVTYRLHGENGMALRMKYPPSSATASIIAALSRAAFTNSHAAPSLHGTYSKQEVKTRFEYIICGYENSSNMFYLVIILFTNTEFQDDWHEVWRTESVVCVFTHSYHPLCSDFASDLPNHVLQEFLPKKCVHPIELASDHLHVEIEIDGSEVKFTGLLIKFIIELKNNYFGFYDSVRISSFSQPYKTCPVFYTEELVVEIKKSYSETLIQVCLDILLYYLEKISLYTYIYISKITKYLKGTCYVFTSRCSLGHGLCRIRLDNGNSGWRTCYSLYFQRMMQKLFLNGIGFVNMGSSCHPVQELRKRGGFVKRKGGFLIYQTILLDHWLCSIFPIRLIAIQSGSLFVMLTTGDSLNIFVFVFHEYPLNKLPLAIHSMHLEHLRSEFIRKHDSLTRRLYFLWDNEDVWKCACFGGTAFFTSEDIIGKSFLLKLDKKYFTNSQDYDDHSGIFRGLLDPNKKYFYFLNLLNTSVFILIQNSFRILRDVVYSFYPRICETSLSSQKVSNMSSVDTISFYSAMSKTANHNCLSASQVLMDDYALFLNHYTVVRSVSGKPSFGQAGEIRKWLCMTKEGLSSLRISAASVQNSRSNISSQDTDNLDRNTTNREISVQERKFAVYGSVATSVEILFTPLAVEAVERLIISLSSSCLSIHPALLLQMSYRECVFKDHYQPLTESLFTSNPVLDVSLELPRLHMAIFQCGLLDGADSASLPTENMAFVLLDKASISSVTMKENVDREPRVVLDFQVPDIEVSVERRRTACTTSNTAVSAVSLFPAIHHYEHKMKHYFKVEIGTVNTLFVMPRPLEMTARNEFLLYDMLSPSITSWLHVVEKLQNAISKVCKVCYINTILKNILYFIFLVDLYHWLLSAHRERKERKLTESTSKDYINPMDIMPQAFFYCLYRNRRLDWTQLDGVPLEYLSLGYALVINNIYIGMIEQKIVCSPADTSRKFLTPHTHQLVHIRRFTVDGEFLWKMEMDDKGLMPLKGWVSFFLRMYSFYMVLYNNFQVDIKYSGFVENVRFVVALSSVCLIKEVSLVIKTAKDTLTELKRQRVSTSTVVAENILFYGRLIENYHHIHGFVASTISLLKKTAKLANMTCCTSHQSYKNA
uniref:FSA_C domain-containing protein n=1 Tax=Heterorhabditis bacteriophora TaxID=37862 RepID=A0A1I7W8X8_HETBA